MQTQRLTTKPSRFRPALALANGALLLALSGGAQAQVTRSHPSSSQPSETPASGGNSDARSSHPSQTPSNEQKTSGRKESDHGVSGRSGTTGSTGSVSGSGKVNFKVLFPAERRSVVKSVTPTSAPYNGRLPGLIWVGGGIPDSVLFPKLPEDPAPSTDSDTKDSDKDKTGTDTASKSSGSGNTGTDSPSYQRYKESPEASAAKTENGATNRSQIFWPDKDSSPFWPYSVDEVFWWPGDGYGGAPDGNVLYPTPGRVIIKGWPNYAPQAKVSRDEPSPNYRIGEKTMPRRPVDLQPALDDIQRAFQEEQPRLLVSHIQRAEPLAVNAPGEERHFVSADLFLDGLTKLFATGQAITMEFDEPQPLDSDLFAVTAWYVYHDQASATVYRAKIRLVLQAQDDRIILTAFEMD